MQDLSVYYQMVEESIALLGVNPTTVRTEKPGQWSLQKGSAPVWVDVFWMENNNCGYIQVMSPIIEVPQNNTLAFYEELLRTNHNLFGVGFTQYDKWIYIKGIREVDNLQQAEVTAMLNRVGVYADDYDDLFKQKYQATSFRKSDI